MTSPIQKKILKALYTMMKPLVRMLLRAGIGFREFAEVAKMAFVHEASVGYGLRGRETNMSRVAIMTGLSRREVKKIRNQNGDPTMPPPIAPPASEIISQWHNDRRFCDPRRGPKDLVIDGEGDTFAQLVKLYAGDIPPGAMKTELLRIGAIEQLDGRKLRVLKPDYMPSGIDEKLEMSLREIIRPSLETLANNCDGNRSGPLFFQRVIGAVGINEHDVPELRAMAAGELADVCSSMDAAVSKFVPEYPDEQSSTEAGVGLYYYEVSRD